jgi:hypothetical protein
LHRTNRKRAIVPQHVPIWGQLLFFVERQIHRERS